MQKKQKLIVWSVVLLFAAASFAGFFMSAKVGINYSLSDYLADDTDTKKSLEIIGDEFGMSCDMKVAILSISMEEATSFSTALGDVDGVTMVSFDKDSYKDGNAFITLMLSDDEYSEQARESCERVRALTEASYAGRAEYGGSVVSTMELRDMITEEMVYILVGSVLLVIVILLLTSSSWLEPFILLLASGAAIIINVGTNLIYGEISYITNSVAAILQLALSIDYSIVLMHTYRRRKSGGVGGFRTMLDTVKEVIRPVSASGLTTVAGLIALLFMSFGIGFDIGMVLIKGIVISFVTSVTLFPALILLFEGAIEKTAKKSINFGGKTICSFAVKHGKVAFCVFLALVAVCGVLSGTVNYGFTVSTSGDDTTAESNTVMLVYKNGTDDAKNEAAFIDAVTDFERGDGSKALVSYVSCGNTVNELYDAAKAAEKLGVKTEDADLLFAMHYIYGSPDSVKLSIRDFLNYANELLDTDEDVKTLAQGYYSQIKALTLSVNIYCHSAEKRDPADGLYVNLTTPYTYSELVGKLGDAVAGLDAEASAVELPVEYAQGIYIKYAASNCTDCFESLTAEELLDFVEQNVAQNSLFASLLNEERSEKLDYAASMLEKAKKLLKGEDYSRILLFLELPAEGDDATAFMTQINSKAKDLFGEAYLAGLIPSTYDLQQAFDYDSVIINTVTIASVFLIILLLFRSLSLPVVLVTVIQCAIWFVLASAGVMSMDIFFMSYIMASCILMGSTIDYGILLSNSYIDARKSQTKEQALETAIDAALPTVFTSGMTMSVAGFVIYFVASQNAISVTGLLIGIGTVAAAVLVTLALPSVLYVLDGLVLKLTKTH